MTNHAQFQNCPIIKTGILPKTGAEYQLIMQNADQLDAILSLQKTVQDNLSSGAAGFILPKTAEFIKKHFAAGNIIIGVVSNNCLVAQSMLTMPSSVHPYTCMVDMNLPAPLEKICVLHGMLVHPDFRGNNLLGLMTKTCLDTAQQHGRQHAISEIAVANPYSWAVHMKEGLGIHSFAWDAEDNTLLYNMYGHIPSILKNKAKSSFNAQAKKKPLDCPHADLEKQKELIAKGYRGVAYNHQEKTIAFKKYVKKQPSL